MSRPLRIIVPVLALLALALALIGVPVGLVVLVGWPIPTPTPTIDELGDIFAGRSPIPADYLISILAGVMWLLWLQVLWATIIEVAAAYRGRLAHRARMLPGVQLGVGKLVTAATFLATSLAVKPAAAGPLTPVIVATQLDDEPSPTEPAEDIEARRNRASFRPYLTEPGDTWWGIAEQTLGSGTRWKEVRGLNLGRTMADGSVISASTDLLRPDWRLLLPTSSAAQLANPPDRAVVVDEGDTIWAIAREDLEGATPDDTGRVPNAEVAELVEEIAEINRAELNGDPDLIYPGQRLQLPSRPELAARPAPPGPAAAEESDAAAPSAPAAPTAEAVPAVPEEPARPAVPEPEMAEPAVESPVAGSDASAMQGSAGSTGDTPQGPVAGSDASAMQGSAGSTGDTPQGPVAGSDASGPQGSAGSAPDPSVPAAPELPAVDDSAHRPGAASPAVREPLEVAVADDPLPGAGIGEPEAGPDGQPAGRADGPIEEPVEERVEGAVDEPVGEQPADGAEQGPTPRPLGRGPSATPDGPTTTLREPEGSPLAGARASATGVPAPVHPSPRTGDSAPSGSLGASAGAVADGSVPTPSTVVSDTPSPTGEFRQDPASPSADTGADGSSAADTDVDLDLQASVAPGTGDGSVRGELGEPDPVAAVAGEAAELDDGSERAPVFVGLAALTLVGGYLYRARRRRRDTALRNRHPGRRPRPPQQRTRTVARRLAAAAEPEHPEFVNVGLRALGKLLQDVPSHRLPKISGVWVSHNRLVIALAEDSPRGRPPEPFTEFADGSGWSLLRSDFDRVRKIAKGANGPLPLLTTIGTTTALDLALTTNSRAPAEAYGLSSSLLFAVDLEAGRVVSVQANQESATIEALTMMALELATSETADQAEIVCVGFGHRLATFDRVVVVDDLAEILSDLETVTGRAVYAAADASPFATRVGNGAADTWNPVIVFHADPLDPSATTLVELAEKTDGGVTAVCGYPTTSGWTFVIDGDRISCPDLPGDLAHHQFQRPELDGVELIADLFDEPAAEVDLDDEFWQPLDPVEADHTWHVSVPDQAQWRPMHPVTTAEVDEDRAGSQDSSVAVVSEQPDVDSVSEPGWADLETIDADSWPETEMPMPVLPELRHSVEHRPPVEGRPGPSQAAPCPEEPSGPDDRSEPADEPVDEPADRSEPAEVPDDVGPADESAADGRAVEQADEESAAEGRAVEQPDDVGPADESDEAGRGRHLYVVGRTSGGGSGSAVSPGERRPSGQDETGHEVRVSVLGNLTIEGHHIGDRSKPWKYTKTPELILYLLLHPNGASQDLLMEQLFPEQPPNRPRLNQLVSDARTKALGTTSDGRYHLPHASPTEPFYKLNPTVGFDLRDFALHCANARRAESLQVQRREWEAALRLVRGRPFTVPHDGYEWAVPEIEATIVKVEEAAVALADIGFELGDYELAVWATKQGLLTGTGYYELLVKRGRAALLLQDPEEIVRAFADLQVSLEYSGAPEEGMPDLSSHPELADVYNELSSDGRTKDRT